MAVTGGLERTLAAQRTKYLLAIFRSGHTLPFPPPRLTGHSAPGSPCYPGSAAEWSCFPHLAERLRDLPGGRAPAAHRGPSNANGRQVPVTPLPDHRLPPSSFVVTGESQRSTRVDLRSPEAEGHEAASKEPRTQWLTCSSPACVFRRVTALPGPCF